MFKALRVKELILIALFVIFVPSYAFYQRVIAPRFGSARIKTLQKKISHLKSQAKIFTGYVYYVFFSQYTTIVHA